MSYNLAQGDVVLLNLWDEEHERHYPNTYIAFVDKYVRTTAHEEGYYVVIAMITPTNLGVNPTCVNATFLSATPIDKPKRSFIVPSRATRKE